MGAVNTAGHELILAGAGTKQFKAAVTGDVRLDAGIMQFTGDPVTVSGQ